MSSNLASFLRPTIFFLAITLATLAATSTPTNAAAIQPSLTLTGTLTITWGDPAPSSFSLHPSSLIYYWLTADDSTTYSLAVSPAVLRAAGGLERINRQRVTVQGILSNTAPSARSADGSASLHTHSIQILDEAPQQFAASAVSGSRPEGSQPYISLLCKFANVEDEPQNLAYFQDMYSPTYPGLSHYWEESSYDQINLNGSTAVNWITLPEGRGYYINSPNMLTRLFEDCTAAADPLIDFSQYVGINMMFNATLDCCAWGGSISATLDGINQVWPATWEPPWAYADIAVLAHEMGHSFGMPHSSAGLDAVYDNIWDVLSDPYTYCDLLTDPTYGCLGQHTISYHRDLVGWIPTNQRYTAGPGSHTITLEQLTLPQTNNYLMAKIPVSGSDDFYYTVEVRSTDGYDIKLPLEGDANAVIIHEVDTGRDEPAHLIDADNDGDTGDEDAQWTIGETYFSVENGVSITVDQTTASGFVVTIYVGAIDPYEPSAATSNNTAATATPITYGQTKPNALINPAADLDYYTFTGNAGDNIIATVNSPGVSPLDAHLTLYNSAQTQLAANDNTNGTDPQITYTLPSSGTYYLAVRAASGVPPAHPNDGGPTHEYALSLTLNQQLYLSPKTAGTVSGISVGPEDILRYDTTNATWSLYFDGSDLGLSTKKAISAFTILDDGSILLVFDKKTTIASVGPFLPQDIALFIPTSIGSDTAGTIHWYLDGSDLGLTTTSEKIDALEQLPNGRILISTTGAATVTGPSGNLKANDEDILAFNPTATGTTTAGTWSLYFDGSTLPGMGGEDITALSVNPTSNDLYLALESNFTINGTSGTPHDILRLPPTGNTYTPTLYWLGPSNSFTLNLANLHID